MPVSGNRAKPKPCCAGSPASASGIPRPWKTSKRGRKTPMTRRNTSGYRTRRNSISAKALVLDFVEACLPDAFDEVRQIFKRRGAYARFRDLLHRKKALDRWYAFEAEATEKALRQWCEDNDITIDEGSDEATRPELSS